MVWLTYTVHKLHLHINNSHFYKKFFLTGSANFSKISYILRFLFLISIQKPEWQSVNTYSHCLNLFYFFVLFYVPVIFFIVKTNGYLDFHLYLWLAFVCSLFQLLDYNYYQFYKVISILKNYFWIMKMMLYTIEKLFSIFTYCIMYKSMPLNKIKLFVCCLLAFFAFFYNCFVVLVIAMFYVFACLYD